MKNKSPKKDTRAIGKIVNDIERDLQRLRDVLESMIDKVRDGDVAAVKSVDSYLLVASKILVNITNAELKLDDARQKSGGSVSDVSFDFESARDEILGKLDRISQSG